MERPRKLRIPERVCKQLIQRARAAGSAEALFAQYGLLPPPVTRGLYTDSPRKKDSALAALVQTVGVSGLFPKPRIESNFIQNLLMEEEEKKASSFSEPEKLALCIRSPSSATERELADFCLLAREGDILQEEAAALSRGGSGLTEQKQFAEKYQQHARPEDLVAVMSRLQKTEEATMAELDRAILREEELLQQRKEKRHQKTK